MPQEMRSIAMCPSSAVYVPILSLVFFVLHTGSDLSEVCDPPFSLDFEPSVTFSYYSGG